MAKYSTTEEYITEDDELDLQDAFFESAFVKRKVEKEEKTTDEYVSKDEMWEEIRLYYVSLGDVYDWGIQKLKIKNTVFPPISLKLAKMIDDIAIRMGHRTNFINYTYLDEMRGDGKQKMFKAIRDGSFKCFSRVLVIDQISVEDGMRINYLDKKGKTQYKLQEETDVFETDATGKVWMTFRANAFGYFCRINSNSFLNRIKKEKLAEDTKKRYQDETWEKVMSTDLWSNVRRPKFIDHDENDASAE